MTLVLCVLNAAWSWFFVWVSMTLDWGRDQAIQSAAGAVASAIASMAAIPFLAPRLDAGDRWARVTVTLLCVGALVANVLVWGEVQGFVLGFVPVVASVMIWRTPAPLPQVICTESFV
jgi:hypothetical protein